MMSMGNVISDQLEMFLRSILLGGSLGLLYDLLRPLRRLGKIWWNTFLDAGISLTAAAVLCFFVMAGDGELRLFILLGALGGGVLYFSLLSQSLQSLWTFWFDLLWMPVRLCGKVLHFFHKTAKKLFSFCKNWFTIIYTKCRSADSSGQGGDESVSANSQTKKKRPSGKLTALILLVLLVGVGVQLYNMYGQLQIARAEEAYYAQQLSTLQEENQRLSQDIANSDDLDLIEDIARNDLGMVKRNEKIFRYGN